MTCKDCIHFDACVDIYEKVFKLNIEKTNEFNGADKSCSLFSDKHQYVKIVRCKDCKFRGTIFCRMVHETLGNGLVDYAVDNGYCETGMAKND